MNTVVNFRGQKYSSIKSRLIKKGELFHDAHFPANSKSIFFSKVDADIVWKRPKELCQVPKLLIENATSDDLYEGELGNSWFVSACTCLTQEPKLWQRIVPNYKEQEWGPDRKYAGIFHFQFWRYGQWIDVVIDDLLPTKDGKLLFCQCTTRNEFWSPLLEKAYAKIYGDYETLQYCHPADAMVDFTGGLAEKIVLSELKLEEYENKKRFFNDLMDNYEDKAFMICSNTLAGYQGLVKGHGYCVTAVLNVDFTKSLVKALGSTVVHLLRLRNPWGPKDWTGEWSEGSPQWKALGAKDREKLGIKFLKEGEMWINLEDFINCFTNLDICHFVNTSFFSLKKTWYESVLPGEWRTGARDTPKDRSGGSVVHHDTFLANPQFIFDVSGIQDRIMVCMEQSDESHSKEKGEAHKCIGFTIIRVEDNRRFRIHDIIEKVITSEYKISRNIFVVVLLRKGRYGIIPTTKEPGVAGNFLIRMYTPSQSNARQLVLDYPKPPCPCIGGYRTVTRVNVIKCEGLDKPAKIGAKMDVYVLVKCDNESAKSLLCCETLNPVWNFKVLFYRKIIEHPIIIEIYNRNVMLDDFLGMTTVRSSNISGEPESMVMQLYGKKKKVPTATLR